MLPKVKEKTVKYFMAGMIMLYAAAWIMLDYQGLQKTDVN